MQLERFFTFLFFLAVGVLCNFVTDAYVSLRITNFKGKACYC